jgi:hypothetical protein
VEGLQKLYQSYALELWLWLAIVVLLLLIWLIIVHVRLGQVLRQQNLLLTGHLGSLLDEHPPQAQDTDAKAERPDHPARRIEEYLSHHLRLGVVRFNPFEDTGGDQSFAIALVDRQGDGVVISSLHGRKETRVYAKPLKKGESAYPLAEEEKEAIARACSFFRS